MHHQEKFALGFRVAEQRSCTDVCGVGDLLGSDLIHAVHSEQVGSRCEDALALLGLTGDPAKGLLYVP